MGGFNNNPTCRQFVPSYKKIVTHVHTIVPDTGNCVLQDRTQILKSFNVSSTTKDISKDELCNIISLDHDYLGSNGWSWDEYSHEIVIYIAGSIVRSIKKIIKCEMCLDQLESHTISSRLINLKNIYPDRNKIRNKDRLC